MDSKWRKNNLKKTLSEPIFHNLYMNSMQTNHSISMFVSFLESGLSVNLFHALLESSSFHSPFVNKQVLLQINI